MATVHSAQPTAVLQQPAQVVPIQNVAHVPGQLIGTTSPSTDPRLKHKKTIYRLGVTELVIGGLCIILTIVPLSITTSELEKYWEQQYYIDGFGRYRINTSFTRIASGIWAGIFTIITGILGVRIRRNHSKSTHIANMIMAIITANITFTAAVLSGIAAGLSYFSGALIAIQVIISVLNISSMIITIIHASFCCSGACYSGDNRTTQQVIYVPAQPNMAYPQQQPQYVQGPNGQLMLVTNQPYMVQGYTTPAMNTGYPGYYPTQQATQPGNMGSAYLSAEQPPQPTAPM